MADNNDNGGSPGPLAQLRETAGRNPITAKLYDAGEDYLKAKAESMISGAGRKLGRLTEQLNNPEAGGAAVKGLSKLAEGKSPASAMMSAAGSGIKDKIKGLVGRGRRPGGPKVTSIVEDLDIGVPPRMVYDQWTQFQEFTSFAKGVTGAEKTDDVNSNWRFKIFWSNRSMKATVTEQIPDQRIVWTTDGAKGTIKGVVTFHPLGENLTKVLMVIEYYPRGFFEKTGNIWRAQGRRARLDLKHFRRFVMMRGEASDDPWRGEIRDGEVVRSHEDVVAAEESEETEAPEEIEPARGEEDYAEEEYPAEEEEYADEDEEGEYYEDEYPEEYEDEDEDEDEFEDEDYEDYQEESEPTPNGRSPHPASR